MTRNIQNVMVSLLHIMLLTIPSFGALQNLFKNSEIIERQNADYDLVPDEFIIFFENSCLAKNDFAIQQLLKQYDCYILNEEMQDEFPDIIDHWIVMDKIKGCDHDDEKFIDFDEFCIKTVEQQEIIMTNNECTSKLVEDALWNLDLACPSIPNGFEYIDYGLSSYDPNFDIIVMDSGIEVTHPEFHGITINRIYDAYPTSLTLSDHGTHVAGLHLKIYIYIYILYYLYLLISIHSLFAFEPLI